MMSLNYKKLLTDLSDRVGLAFEQEPLLAMMTAESYKKGEYFCKQGDDCPFLGIIDSGAFKAFYLDQNGKEYVRSFLSRCDVAGPFSDILQGSASTIYIKALTDSSLARVKFQDFRALANNPKIAALYLKTLELKYIEKERRTYDLISNRSQERIQLLKSLPETVLDHASNSDLASYLNMTPETLSRLKKAK